MSATILTVEIRLEHDVVCARQRARQIAGRLGFDLQGQTRIATAVSEIARNAFAYAGGGTVDFGVDGEGASQALVAWVRDEGPGIADLGAILEGRYTSTTGMGLGIVAARRLVDRFEIDSSPGRGTTVLLGKTLPRWAPVVTGQVLGRIAGELARLEPKGALDEIRQQNRELARTLDELRSRQEQLVRLNQELEDTNRGVVALYAELDEKADHLRRADELKSRFLSDMSHEFRTPLNSILALSRFLLDRTDGELAPEQERQVTFIRRAAEDLSDLVNDLLDLAKVEAGRIVIRPTEFHVADLFSALKGMLRPLLVNDAVSLVFEDPAGIPPLDTDEAKVSQILRNFISNALKFTERGEIRVTASAGPSDDTVAFSVSDTGIGIAAEDQELIFQEFTQVEGPHQKRVKGTGLGLPLSKKLAELLGGRVSVQSAPGRGSTFTVAVPRTYRGYAEAPAHVRRPDPTRFTVLVVEDDAETLLAYERHLRGTGFEVIPARTLREARQALARFRPAAVVLDLLLPGDDAWGFLADLKRDEATRGIPVLVATVVDNRRKCLALGADDSCLKPVAREWLLGRLRAATRAAAETLLVVDDDEISRYVLKGLLADTRYAIAEAEGGAEGIRLARERRPAAILLDLAMPEMDGFEVLERLAADPATRDIPVVVNTARALSEDERRRLAPHAAAILSKEAASREAAVDALRQAFARAGGRARASRAA